MKPCRLHLTGASGCGTTTLGFALAASWAVPHADADDYMWRPTVPAYEEKRPEAERLELMREVFLPRAAWVLSGSLMGWGDPLMEQFDAVVFLVLDTQVRLDRLEARERTRLGPSIDPGGAAADGHRAFMDWARGYDDPQFEGRNLARHHEWLARLGCPVLRLDSERPVPELLRAIDSWQPDDDA